MVNFNWELVVIFSLFASFMHTHTHITFGCPFLAILNRCVIVNLHNEYIIDAFIAYIGAYSIAVIIHAVHPLSTLYWSMVIHIQCMQQTNKRHFEPRIIINESMCGFKLPTEINTYICSWSATMNRSIDRLIDQFAITQDYAVQVNRSRQILQNKQ